MQGRDDSCQEPRLSDHMHRSGTGGGRVGRQIGESNAEAALDLWIVWFDI